MAKGNSDSNIQDKLQIALAALAVLAKAIEVFNKLGESYRINGIDKAVGSFFTKEEEPKKNKRRRKRNRNKHKITNQTNNAKILTNKTITKTKDIK